MYKNVRQRELHCEHRMVIPKTIPILTQEEIMNLSRRLLVGFLGISFCLSLAVVTADAQRTRRWEGSNEYQSEWRSGRNRGWENRGRRSNYYRNRYRSLSWRERRRLARIMRYRMANSRNRYYNTGYMSRWERRRLARRANRYRTNQYRYNNW